MRPGPQGAVGPAGGRPHQVVGRGSCRGGARRWREAGEGLVHRGAFGETGPESGWEVLALGQTVTGKPHCPTQAAWGCQPGPFGEQRPGWIP